MAHAGPGHDHGEESPAIGQKIYVPKLVAESELAELVAVVEGRKLRLYVDGWADNRPLDATLTLELNGEPVDVKRLDVGLFETDIGKFKNQQAIGLVATLNLKDWVDLLSGDLILASVQGDGYVFHWDDYVWHAAVILGVLILILATLWVANKRRVNKA